MIKMRAVNAKRFRNEKGLSMEQVRDLTGLSKSTISESENPNGNPTEKTLAKLADVYGVNVDDFYKDVLSNETELVRADQDIRKIERARSKMPQQDKEKMMKILELSFEDYFEEE